MLVCSCCLDSGHILDKICISEKIKVPSHTGFRRSVAVWDAQALHHHSGAELRSWSAHVHKVPFSQWLSRQNPGYCPRIKSSGSISSLLTVHRTWCDLTQVWWPHRQPWTHWSSYVQNHRRKCRQYKLWVHTLLDKGTSFKALQRNQHIGNAFQHRLCQGNKNWVFLKWYQMNRKKIPEKPKDLLAGKWQKASSHALSSGLKN